MVVGQADINTGSGRPTLRQLIRNSNITFGAGTATDYRFRGGEDVRLVVGDGKYVLAVADQQIFIHQDSWNIQAATAGATIGFAGFGDWDTRLQVNKLIDAGSSHLVFGSLTELTTVVGGGNLSRVTEIPTGVVHLSAGANAISVQVYPGTVHRSNSAGQVDEWTVHPGGTLNVGRDGPAQSQIAILNSGATNAHRAEFQNLLMDEGDYLTLVNEPNKAIQFWNFDFTGSGAAGATIESIGPFFSRLVGITAGADDLLQLTGSGRLDVEQANNTGTCSIRIPRSRAGSRRSSASANTTSIQSLPAPAGLPSKISGRAAPWATTTTTVWRTTSLRST